MDNACIYHNNNLIIAVEEIDSKILYLPSYSSDFNPIEMTFLALKS